MKRLGIIAAFVLVGLLTIIYYRVHASEGEAGEYDGVTSWPPNAAAIHSALTENGKRQPVPSKAQLQIFSEMYTKRFRNHGAGKPVRLKFTHDALTDQDRITLMCPALMEPWNMDWLAVNAWREVKNDFGISYPIDICVTYIGMPQIKVAELRPLPGNANKVEIRYRSPKEVRRDLNGGRG